MDDEILVELRAIKKLLALQAVKGEDFTNQVLFLNSAGFNSAEISSILNRPASSVRSTLSRKKK